MEKRKRMFIAATLCFGLIGVGLIVASLATDHWITAHAIGGNQTTNSSVPLDDTTKFTANVTFGLFRGQKSINYGFGARAVNLQLKDEIHNFGLFSFGMWVSTILMVSLGIVWGLISVGFAVFNIFGKPIETITGPLGLYLWNMLAFFFTLVGLILYLALYFSTFKHNVLPEADLEKNFSTKDRAYLDYSFYLVLGAGLAYFFNIILLALSGYKLKCSFGGEAEKVMDNGIILY